MNRTQNDLSFDSTKLDYQALITTTEVAFVLTKEAIYHELNALMQYPLNGCYYLDAQRLEQHAKNLSIISETLHALKEGLERSQLKIVNKPPVEKLHCDRCGEMFKDTSNPSDSKAEIVDSQGNTLIIHQDCMQDSDTIA